MFYIIQCLVRNVDHNVKLKLLFDLQVPVTDSKYLYKWHGKSRAHWCELNNSVDSSLRPDFEYCKPRGSLRWSTIGHLVSVMLAWLWTWVISAHKLNSSRQTAGRVPIIPTDERVAWSLNLQDHSLNWQRSIARHNNRVDHKDLSHHEKGAWLEFILKFLSFFYISNLVEKYGLHLDNQLYVTYKIYRIASFRHVMVCQTISDQTAIYLEMLEYI